MASPDANPRSRDALTRADIPELVKVKAVVEAMKAGHPSLGTSKGTLTDTGEPFVCCRSQRHANKFLQPEHAPCDPKMLSVGTFLLLQPERTLVTPAMFVDTFLLPPPERAPVILMFVKVPSSCCSPWGPPG